VLHCALCQIFVTAVAVMDGSAILGILLCIGLLSLVSVYVVHSLRYGSWRQKRRRPELERVAAQRPAWGREEFGAHFQSLGIPDQIWQNVHDFLQSQMPVSDFPMHPSDSVFDIYDVGDGLPADEVIADLVSLCKCRAPRDKDWDAIDPIRTVEDLILFLNRLYVGDNP
jgi:hypothetical protein